MNILVLFMLGYLLYRFIGGFLIPLFRTTRHVRQQFNNMNERPTKNGSQQESNYGPSGQPGTHKPEAPSKVGEYIDFEEIKKA
jgi:hypothetical protein